MIKKEDQIKNIYLEEKLKGIIIPQTYLLNKENQNDFHEILDEIFSLSNIHNLTTIELYKSVSSGGVSQRNLDICHFVILQTFQRLVV